MSYTLAIDCMGGDHGPSVTVPAAVSYIRRDPACSLLLVGLQDVLNAELKRLGAEDEPRLLVVHATEVIGMDEPPAQAMRGKKDSSMRVAIDLVKSGRVQAAVSAGNTGALMAIAKFILKTLPGIDRPAIASILPTMKGHTYVLDLGANVDCTSEHLFQFGLMGAMLVSALESRERPSVGLLNIGEEAIKGNDAVKGAAELLRASDLNFYGNVEGNDIYKGTTDVVVCDGFVGNVALKTSEGLAQMIATFLREEFSRGPLRKLMYLTARPVIQAFRKRLDHRRYNGATLLGLRGVVVKSHGSSDAYGFEEAVARAADAVRNDLIARITLCMTRTEVAA